MMMDLFYWEGTMNLYYTELFSLIQKKVIPNAYYVSSSFTVTHFTNEKTGFREIKEPPHG